MNKTRVLKYYQWTDEKTGVFVDIFPIDACPQDNGIRIKQINGLCRNACKASRPFKFEYKLRNLKILYQRIKFRNLDRQELISQYLTEIFSLNYEKANYVCNLGSPYWEKDIHPKIVFEKYIRVPFENIEVSIIESYDVYLRNIYGNYMVLPSPEKQRAGHTANKFFGIDEKC
jgi:lipopolysaccharide cholinephosphotransferase